jgi:hypothetical protein
MNFFRTFKKSTAPYKVHNMGLRYIKVIYVIHINVILFNLSEKHADSQRLEELIVVLRLNLHILSCTNNTANNSYLWTYDFYGPVCNAFDAGKSITRASGRGLSSGNRDFSGPCKMASSCMSIIEIV